MNVNFTESKEKLKIPPYSIEAEQSVLGALLIDSKEIESLPLGPLDFYQEEHREIFRAMTALVKKGIPIDIVSVAVKLKDAGKLEFTGGISYLMRLADSVPTALNVSYYAKLVRRDSISRQMEVMGEKISDLAGRLEFEDARKVAREIVLLNENVDNKPFSDTFNQEDFERLSESRRFFSSDLHNLTFYLPFMRGENIYIAGKTSTGKTQLALNLVLSFLDKGASVGYISMELGREQLLIRLLNWEFGNEQIRLSDIDIRQKAWWDMGLTLIKQDRFKKFFFIEQYNKLSDIVAWIESHQFDVVFIDYAQLIRSGTGRNRVEEMGESARELRQLSKKRCVVVLSQFNRFRDENEEDIDLSRIRDSGEIEQVSTGIVLIRRDKKDMNQFYYCVAKNQTYGTLSFWKRIDLSSNGRFKEVNEEG